MVWFRPAARLLIAGQAPGDSLRGWLGLDKAAFHDRTRVAIAPMALCFPGYDATGADLPPPFCAATWRARVMAVLGEVPLTVLLGGHALRWHLRAPCEWGGVGGGGLARPCAGHLCLAPSLLAQ